MWIKQLAIEKAPGIDGMAAKLLQSVPTKTCKILLKVIQQCLWVTTKRAMPDFQDGFWKDRGTKNH